MLIKKLALAAALALLLPGLAPAAASTWNVNTPHSEVAFSVRHFLTPVPGRFNDFSGTIVYDPDDLGKSSVEITVQAASIDTNNEDRDNHLRSADFLDVANHPTLSFRSTGIEGSESTLSVTGDLILRGVTKQVTIPVEFLGTLETSQGPKAGFAAEFTLDRQEYGVSWNRVLDQGGAILGDEVKVHIAIEADKAQ